MLSRVETEKSFITWWDAQRQVFLPGLVGLVGLVGCPEAGILAGRHKISLKPTYRLCFKVLVVPNHSVQDEVGEPFFVEYTV